MNTTKPSLAIRRILAAFFVASLLAAARAADQFVQVTNPGWTNSTQYSWSGAWGDYDKDGFLDLFVPNSSAGPDFLYRNNQDGTFSRQSADQVGPIASNSNPSLDGHWADVNNDGQLDLLLLNLGSGPQLYLNRANGTFRSADAGELTQRSFDAWGGLADYDRDGWLDLFASSAASGHPTNLLFHGRGDGTFSVVTNTVVATDQISYSNDAAWGDFDNDGLPDLLVGNYVNRDFFYHNEGHGQFTRLTNSILEKYASGHDAWGDFDNDGFLDLAAYQANGGLRLIRNNRQGDFVSVTNWTSGAAGPPSWVDYDNDGNLDVILIRGQNSASHIGLYHNQGDGAFTPAVDAFTRLNRQWIGGGWGDYDNDGFMDLFVAEQFGNNALFHNLGNTNHWIKFRLEGVVANRSAIGAKVRVKATIGGKTVWQMREITEGSNSHYDLRPNFGLGDATNVDLVRIEWPSGNVQEITDLEPNQMLVLKEVVGIAPANPTASLNGTVTLTRGSAATDTAYQWRFDGVDLVGETNRILKLTGIQASQAGPYSVVATGPGGAVTNHVYLTVDPTFTKIVTGPLVTDLGCSWTAAWGDFDSDGYPDVFVTRYKTGLSKLYHNNGDGTFGIAASQPMQISAEVWSGAVTGDFDNDGKLDLFVPRENKAGYFYFNNGDGTFTASQFQSANPWSAAAIDYDRDGFLDLYLSNDGRLFRNNGDRTFSRMQTFTAGYGGSAWADYDDDGWVEAFGANNNGPSQLFENDGAGGFAPARSLSTALVGAWGDFDNDGRLDLCAAAFSNTTFVYRNLGEGKLKPAQIGLNISGDYNGAAWGDYDNDGFLDLFLTYGNSARNDLYHNNGDGTFARVTTGSLVVDRPIAGGASYQGFWFDYDNNGALDLFVPNGNDAGTVMTSNFLYHNNGNGNSWLKVKLLGTASNRDGVGAKIHAQARYAGQIRWQRRDISAGDICNGNNLIAHFGLRNATNVNVLRIEWPSGAVQELTNVAPRQILSVWEPPSIRATSQEDGACHLTITAEPNRTWRIEGSEDLETWQVIARVTNATPSFGYTDSASAGMVCRFYRVVAE